MGIFEDFGSVIPADKQAAFKAAVSALDGAVKIDSREIAEKLASENPHFKSVIDSVISKAVASHDEKFKAEKLPGMVEEEIKKRGPKPKDPELAAALERIEKMEKETAAAKAAEVRAYQLSKVAPKIVEWGLDPDLAEDFIGPSDEVTDAKLARFEKSFAKARDGYTEKILRERFGNMAPPPKGGNQPTTKEAMRVEYERLMKEGKREQANKIYIQMGMMKE